MADVFTLTPKDAPLKQLSGSKTLFKKQLVRFGEWVDPLFPSRKMVIDRNFAATLVRNFQAGVAGRIPVPLGHPKTDADLVALNRGELVEVSLEDDGLYGILDVRDDEVAKQVKDGTLWDVSISFTDDYLDKESGTRC